MKIYLIIVVSWFVITMLFLKGCKCKKAINDLPEIESKEILGIIDERLNDPPEKIIPIEDAIEQIKKEIPVEIPKKRIITEPVVNKETDNELDIDGIVIDSESVERDLKEAEMYWNTTLKPLRKNTLSRVVGEKGILEFYYTKKVRDKLKEKNITFPQEQEEKIIKKIVDVAVKKIKDMVEKVVEIVTPEPVASSTITKETLAASGTITI